MRSLEEILAEETEFVVGVDLADGSVGAVVFEVNRSIPGTLTRVLGPEHLPSWCRHLVFGSPDEHRYDPTAVDEELEAWEAFQVGWTAREERLRAQRRNAR